ncbi:MAG: DUF1616 domain-containing protein [Parcubacteria group bacterium]|jgi:hypothetical protein
MLEFIQNQILFYISLGLVLFVPGYFLLLAIFGRSGALSRFERFAIAFGLSIVSVDFILFALSRAGVAITRLSTIAGIVIFSAICFAVYKISVIASIAKQSRDDRSEIAAVVTLPRNDNALFNFSKKQFALILLLLFLTLFIKVAYLSGTVLPTSTDMGHHMYWAKWMVVQQALPTYDGMPDFIIGEHTIFGAMALIGGLDFFSAFPPVVLLLVDLLGILTVFLLTLRIFKDKNVAILSLLFLGVLFAISSPQAKFVSGGVIGNLMGNFLMPLAFYFYYRAFSFFGEKRELGREEKKFLGMAIFTTFGLFYTHHLTSFIFLFIFAFLVVLFLALNYREAKNIITRVVRMFFSPEVLPIFLTGLIFFFFIFTPSYIEPSAVGTAVGAPSKATREGLSISALKSSVGEARLALGFLGILLLAYSYRKKDFGFAVVTAWAVMIFVMSSVPQILFINLPSNRIGNYLSYPLAILSAFGLYAVFQKNTDSRQRGRTLFQASFLLIITFVLVNGLADSAASLTNKNEADLMAQTFHSAQYVAKTTSDKDIVLKDHNYINSDAWMKLFFMRGYKYPDSRGFFKRYEDPTKPREMCTLYMISNPGGADAQKCFSETRTNFLMINPRYDSAQFHKLQEFDQVYFGGNVAVYYKRN